MVEPDIEIESDDSTENEFQYQPVEAIPKWLNVISGEIANASLSMI